MLENNELGAFERQFLSWHFLRVFGDFNVFASGNNDFVVIIN